MTKGIVYVLTNEAMPGLVKIGYTTDLKRRIKELSQPSGIPAPFECFFAVEVENPLDRPDGTPWIDDDTLTCLIASRPR